MADFQTTVRRNQTTGLVGEFSRQGPTRALPFRLASGDASANIFGRVFTHVTNQDEEVQAGGTGAFAGFLVSPKEHALRGTVSGGTLAASLTLPNNEIVQISDMGYIYVEIQNAANQGDQLEYSTGVDGDAGQLFAIARTATTPSADRAFVPNARILNNSAGTSGTIVEIQVTN